MRYALDDLVKVYERGVRDFMKTYSVVVTLLMVWSVWRNGCVCVVVVRVRGKGRLM